MFIDVVGELRKRGPMEAARLIGVAPRYITNSTFINLLNSYDLNSRRNDKMLSSQFLAYAGIPDMKKQIEEWLSA